jgi:hypothetical protein
MRDGPSPPVTHLRRCRGESVARHRVPQPLGRGGHAGHWGSGDGERPTARPQLLGQLLRFCFGRA